MKLRPSAEGPFEQATHELPEDLAGMPAHEVLLAYQRKAVLLASTSPLLVIEKSRRIGLTWGLGFLAALTAAKTKAAGGMKVWYMGYDMEMAREFIDVVGMWAKALGLAVTGSGEMILEDERDIKAFRVSFASGFEVVALPSVARAWRGKQGLVIMDEAAFMSDLEEIIKAALALTMWGGRVIIVSTHDGVDNPFNMLLDDLKAGKREGDHMMITFADAMADGLYERIKMMVPATPDKEVWEAGVRKRYGDNASEELDCIPKSGGGSWINPGDYAACEHPDAGKPELYQGGDVFIGRDVSRRRDNSVIYAWEKVGEVKWLRERWVKQNASFAEQDREMDRMIRFYRTRKAKIDQTGMGEKVVEDAQERHGDLVEGVLFTASAKLDLATSYREEFENGLIRLPPDPDIRADHRSVKRASRNNKVLAEGDVHPDEFWAGALGITAAKGDISIYGYESVRTLQNQNQDYDDDLGPLSRYRESEGVTQHGLSRGGGAW